MSDIPLIFWIHLQYNVLFDFSGLHADGRKMVTRSRTGSLTPKQFADSVTSITGSLKAAMKASQDDESTRITRSRLTGVTNTNSAPASVAVCPYTGLFKLGKTARLLS
jgi:hypothetical protein